MTCVVALAEEDCVWIGGDSAGIDGYDLAVRADSKVWVVDDYAFGFQDSFRMGQLLRYSFEAPWQPPDLKDHAFMCTLFIDTVRECFQRGGFGTSKDGTEEGGSFLVGYRGQVYEVGDDYEVGVPADNYAAIGCGGAYALGSLYSTRKTDPSPQDRIKLALEASARHCAGVSPPFTILKSPVRK